MTAPVHGKRLPLVLILLLLFAGTLVLRLRGIDWLLPHSVEPDVHLAVQVEGFRGGLADWEDGVDYGKYPHLLARLLQPLPGRAAPEALDPESARAPLSAHLRRAMGTVLEMRYLIAILGALLVPLTFLLARHWLTPRWSLLAAALVATSTLHQNYSQQARPHVASASLALLAVLACLQVRRRPSRLVCAAAGLAVALAVTSLHSGFAVLLPLAVAVFLGRHNPGSSPPAPGSGPPGPGLLRVLLLGGPTLVGVRLLYPFFFRTTPGEEGGHLSLEEGGLTQSGHSIEWSQFNGDGFGRSLGALWSFDPVLLVLSGVGLLALLSQVFGAKRGPGWNRDQRADLGVALAYALPYCAVIGIFSLTYQRFVVPLLPYLACLGAVAAAGLHRWVGARSTERGRALAAAGLAVLILVPPGWVAWRLGSLRREPDTLERAGQWLVEHTSALEGRVYVSPGIDLPLARIPAAVRADAELPHGVRPDLWVDYQARLLAAAGSELPLFAAGHPVFRFPVRDKRSARRLRFGLAEWLEELGAGWIVVPLGAKSENIMAWRLREYARSHGELRVRFEPEPDEHLWEFPFSYATRSSKPGAPLFAVRTLRAEAVGPAVEVYRLAGPPWE